MTRGGERKASSLGRLWTVAFVVLLVCIAIWRWTASGAPSGGDGAQYLAHALAIAEGRSYDDIGYLYTPIMWTVGPPKYPPGLPLTLAPAMALFDPFGSAPLIVMHLSLLAFAAMVGVYFAREGGAAMGWGVAAMVTTAMLLRDTANVVGSDLGFCAFVWGALVVADREGPWSWKRSGLLTVLGGGALLYRLAAAPLVPAIAVFAALKRRDMGWAALLPVLVWLGVLMLVFQQFGPGEAPSGAPQVTEVGGTAGNFLQSFSRWIDSTGSRLGVYQNALSDAYLYPLPSRAANRVYQLGAFGISLVGLWPWIRKRTRSFGAALAASTILMLAVSPVWQGRYLWVLTPFLCYGLLRGLVAMVGWVGRRIQRDLWPRAPLPAAFSVAIIGMTVVSAALQPRSTHPPERESWREVSAALTELDTGTPARVASNRPRKVAWFTGAEAMPIVWWGLDSFLLEAEARQVTHVVYVSSVNDPERLAEWERWRLEYPDLFVSRAVVGPASVFELTRYAP